MLTNTPLNFFCSFVLILHATTEEVFFKNQTLELTFFPQHCDVSKHHLIIFPFLRVD